MKKVQRLGGVTRSCHVIRHQRPAPHWGDDIVLPITMVKLWIRRFGKMGGQHEWFYDLLALYRVTLNGQLFLLMLIERLTEAGFDVFYGNTDGITARVEPNREGDFYEICNAWQLELGFELEYTKIEKMMLRDVNNYTLRTTEGYTKEKGEFIRKPRIGKKLDAPIVAKAIGEWFYNDTPIKDTVKASKDITDFCMSGKVGHQFDCVLHTVEPDETGNPTKIETELQRVNRYYAGTGPKAGTLLKKNKHTGRFNNMLKHSQVAIINDYSDPPEIPVNYTYYINRAERILAVFNSQQTLF